MLTNYLGTLVITAYCACTTCCGPRAKGITAMGRVPVQNVTVAASRRIPLGTSLAIDGIGWRRVEDRLAKRYDDRVDVYFTRHADAIRFGLQTRRVWSVTTTTMKK